MSDFIRDTTPRTAHHRIGQTMTKADNPKCVRCHHRAADHTLDDASGFSPSDPGAPFRCCWPVKHEGMGAKILCDCPDMVVPADAGWPYNNAPEHKDAPIAAGAPVIPTWPHQPIGQ